MMKKVILIVLMLIVQLAIGQEIPAFKFGKITAADLKNTSYAIDTGASAVVLADIGSTKVIGNSDAFFSLEFKHHKRIHILKKAAYHLATVEIELYKEGDDEEVLKDFKAATYNLENGRLVESKADKSAIIREKVDGNHVVMKFTFPNVKEGSVIEFEYKIVSDFLFNLQPWYFQSHIPHLWSQYTVSMPEFLEYMVIEFGSLPYHLKDQKFKSEQYIVGHNKDAYHGYRVTERYDITAEVADFKWCMKDVPALAYEPYTGPFRNYVARMEFQLAGYLPPIYEQKIMTTWPDLTKRFLERKDFGQQLNNTEFWVASLMKNIPPAITQLEKAQNIFHYVRDNFKCTGYNQLFANENLDKIASKKAGGVAEINLLLTALLRGAGLQADPVIISTRSNGMVNNSYPIASPFNYVLSKVNIDGKEVFLDASRPRMGFGKLHYECYNGHGRVVNATATMISLRPEQLNEREQTTLFIYREPNGKWSAKGTKLYGHYGSDELRELIVMEGLGGVKVKLNKDFGSELKVDSVQVDSLNKYDEPVEVRFTLKNEDPAGDIIYFTPVLGERYQSNPFKSAERKFPVEFSFMQSDLYTLTMEVPVGYVVDEMPKPVSLKLNSKGDATFEYSIKESNNVITMNYNLQIKRTQFSPAEYNDLREFFSRMISKLEEQIVFKKK